MRPGLISPEMITDSRNVPHPEEVTSDLETPWRDDMIETIGSPGMKLLRMGGASFTGRDVFT